MKERIRKIMERENMSQKEFSEATGIKQSSLSSILNGHSQATNRHVEAIYKRFPEISLSWLMFGQGEMIAQTAETGDNTQAGASNSDINGERVRQGSTPLLPFDAHQDNPEAAPHIEGATTNQSAVRGLVKIIDKPARRVREIQVIYDDNTIETFLPKPNN